MDNYVNFIGAVTKWSVQKQNKYIAQHEILKTYIKNKPSANASNIR